MKGKFIQKNPNSSPMLSTSKAFSDKGSLIGDRSSNNVSNSVGRKPSKKLSNEELEEKRRKGLCYWCDKKYSTDHSCKSKKLYNLEVIGENFIKNKESGTEEEEEVDNKGSENEEEAIEGTPAMISLNALASIQTLANYNTMRVCGSVQGQKIRILIDSGSTQFC